jgi:Zn finger protein HypA/HybF involved in hydrogenase expression
MVEINLDNKPEQERCPLCKRWITHPAGETAKCPHCGAGAQYFRKDKKEKESEEK